MDVHFFLTLKMKARSPKKISYIKWSFWDLYKHNMSNNTAMYTWISNDPQIINDVLWNWHASCMPRLGMAKSLNHTLLGQISLKIRGHNAHEAKVIALNWNGPLIIITWLQATIFEASPVFSSSYTTDYYCPITSPN